MIWLKRFALALVLPSRSRLVVDAVLALLLVGALHLFFVGVLVSSAAWPVFEANPSFKHTGPDVEICFAWLRIRSVKAFLWFYLYFLVVCYPLLFPFGYRALPALAPEEERQRRWKEDIADYQAEPGSSADGDRDHGSS